MSQSKLIKITDKISYLPSSRNPISCEVVFIKGDGCTWIFDTGLTKEAAHYINQVEGPKKVVISHWHPDHTLNLAKIKYDELYVSRHTKKYTWRGTVLESDTDFGDVKVIVLPSSHAKGCLCLLAGDYAFMGDGTYSKERKGNHTYNVQLLQAEIEVLEKIPCRYVCLDHDPVFVQERKDLINLHKTIYSRRTEGNPIISVEDFFNADGTVNYDKD
ncbi:MAG: MBL fold metallo-hydrolase [Treponema sp.]|nr:MBL fold metallo-hydrolase [Treponema sp.]